MFGIDALLGLGGKIVDKVWPSADKKLEADAARQSQQAAITQEGERSRNYFTPRAVLMYGLTFAVLYGVVFQPMAVAFGIALPKIDYSDAVRILIGMLGLG